MAKRARRKFAVEARLRPNAWERRGSKAGSVLPACGVSTGLNSSAI